MENAADRFAALSTKLGGPEAVKAFFSAYGTDGFAPTKEKAAVDTNAEAAKDAKKLAEGMKLDTTLKVSLHHPSEHL